MDAQPEPAVDPMDDARRKIIEAALPHVIFDGWSRRTLEMAVSEADVDPGVAHLAFPRGGVDMALAFHRMNDAKLAEELTDDAALASMPVREKVAHAVRRRLELVADHREAVRRAATLLALPPYAAEGARAIWQTSDTIWTAIGDTSTDYNYYTKRAILSSVYSSTVLYWLGDDTPGHSATWGFLERRIDNVMQFEKVKAMVTENPLAKAAMWGPSKILSVFAPRRADSAVPKTPDPSQQAPLPGSAGPGPRF